MSQPSTPEIREYVENNRDLLTRMLAYGDSETRGYALATLLHSESVDEIDAVLRKLKEIRREVAE